MASRKSGYTLASIKKSLLQTNFKSLTLKNQIQSESELNIDRAVNIKDTDLTAFDLEIKDRHHIPPEYYSSRFESAQDIVENTP